VVFFRNRGNLEDIVIDIVSLNGYPNFVKRGPKVNVKGFWWQRIIDEMGHGPLMM
jgi:hypothetical protein